MTERSPSGVPVGRRRWFKPTPGGRHPKSNTRIRLLHIAICFLLAAATTAHALTPATLLNPQLEAQPINLAGLNGGTLSYFDEQRRLTQAPVAGFVRLTLTDDQTLAKISADEISGNSGNSGNSGVAGVFGGAMGLVELVDGQRMAGRWSGASRDGEAILWTHPTLGRFTLGLDDVHRVVMQVTGEASSLATFAADGGTPEGDTVVLRNGDRLVGFLVAVSAESVTILPNGAADEVALTLPTVASITLANPLASPDDVAVAGDLVALTDGSRVRGGGVAIQRETLRFVPLLTDAMQPIELGLGLVRRIDFAGAGLRLVELGEQPMHTVAGGGAFGLELLPTVDDSGVRLHAPVTVVFELPEGAQRFGATALLDLPSGLPRERAAWADLELSVQAGEATPPMRLWAEQPEGVLNLSLEGAHELRLDVDPGVNGPVLDRLLLRDAVLLIQVPDAKPGSGDADP